MLGSRDDSHRKNDLHLIGIVVIGGVNFTQASDFLIVPPTMDILDLIKN